MRHYSRSLLAAVALLVCGARSEAAGVHSAPQLVTPFKLAQADSAAGPVDLQVDEARIKAEMAVIGSSELPGEREWQRKKNARVAMISSMVLPGAGQVYNGRRWKAVIMVGAATWFLTNASVENKKAEHYLRVRDASDPGSADYINADALFNFHKETRRDYLWWYGATWLIGVLDAWIDAHLYDVRAVDPTVIEGTNQEKYFGLRARF